MIANLSFQAERRTQQIKGKRQLKCLEGTLGLLRVICFLALWYAGNTLALHILSLLYICFTFPQGRPLCCFSAALLCSKQTFRQTVELIDCDSPSAPWLIGHDVGASARRIKPKCHSPRCEQSDIIVACVVVNYSQSSPQVIHALWSLCCMSVCVCQKREGEGEKKEGGGGNGGKKEKKKKVNKLHIVWIRDWCFLGFSIFSNKLT